MERERCIRFHVHTDNAGRTLLDFLVCRFPCFSRDDWERRITGGKVRVNGACAGPDHVFAFGDFMEYLAWDVPEPDVPTRVDIVYRDGDLLVVDKPAGLPCHPGGRFFNNTLWSVLKNRHGVETPALVNRLDRETSGLMIVAASPRAAARCQRQFVARMVRKEYIAVAEGVFPATLEALGRIERDPASPVRKKMRFVPGAAGEDDPSRAHTLFKCRGTAGGLSVVAAQPATGRTHQIRATLEALGFPLVGDKLYRPDPGLFLRFCAGTLTGSDMQALRMERQALHSATICFRHPENGRTLEFVSEMPADMQAVLQQAGMAPPGSGLG